MKIYKVSEYLYYTKIDRRYKLTTILNRLIDCKKDNKGFLFLVSSKTLHELSIFCNLKNNINYYFKGIDVVQERHCPEDEIFYLKQPDRCVK